MTIALRVENVGKAYRRYPNSWSRLVEWASLGKAVRHTAVWVLRNVSFEIQPGEAVGVIGQNGAGKSTLLKLITGTTRPTAGAIALSGRTTALLELGMGFHPQFTGRQNALLSGQVMGFSSAQIAEAMPAIEVFAEIGSYIDEPVRVYSTGMQLRLAFSIATALRPDILIIDEALAVGDTYFTHKCMARIREFKEQGTTLLFVSHDPGAVKTLCDRALLLEQGLLVRDGSPDEVLDYYNAVIAKREADYAIRESERSRGEGVRTTRSGNARARIAGVELLESGESVRAVRMGSQVCLRVSAEVRDAIDDLTAGFVIRDRLGNDVFGTNTHHLDARLGSIEAGASYRFDFHIESLSLGVGNYSVSVALHSEDTHVRNNYDWWDQALVFQVVPGRAPFSIGVCALSVTCQAGQVEAAVQSS